MLVIAGIVDGGRIHFRYCLVDPHGCREKGSKSRARGVPICFWVAFVTGTEPVLNPSTVEWTTKAEDAPAIDPNPYAPSRRGNFLS